MHRGTLLVETPSSPSSHAGRSRNAPRTRSCKRPTLISREKDFYKALVTTSKALVSTSFLLLVVRHLFLVAYCIYFSRERFLFVFSTSVPLFLLSSPSLSLSHSVFPLILFALWLYYVCLRKTFGWNNSCEPQSLIGCGFGPLDGPKSSQLHSETVRPYLAEHTDQGSILAVSISKQSWMASCSLFSLHLRSRKSNSGSFGHLMLSCFNLCRESIAFGRNGQVLEPFIRVRAIERYERGSWPCY